MEAPERTRGGTWLLVGKLALGVALLIVVILIASSVQNRGSSSAHMQAPVTAPPVAAPQIATTTTVPLTPLEQANADRGYLAVIVNVDTVTVYDGLPPAGKAAHTFGLKDKVGLPSTFLVTSDARDASGNTWYEVMVPKKPNGTRGWLAATDVTTQQLSHSIQIYLSEHRLDLLDRGELVRSYPIGVGTENTPTPPGDYYLTTKMRPPNPNGLYGVLAMGTSAFSETLKNWVGDAQVGIHGTNEPQKVGTDVSHGCIRMRNEDILQLSNDVPLGTPVNVYQ